MPRQRKRKTKKVTTIFSYGKHKGIVDHVDIPENRIPIVKDSAQMAAERHGTKLKIIESPSRSRVSFSGVTQAQWDAIFKKKKKGKGNK